jgi:hypothetical protein
LTFRGPPPDRRRPGTLRGHLLSQGRAKEAILRLEDLSSGFYLGNSVRGLVRATLAPC